MTRTYTGIIVEEIPHSGRRSVWMANDKQDFIERVAKAFSRYDGTPESCDESAFDAWVDYNGHDLKSQNVYDLENCDDEDYKRGVELASERGLIEPNN